MKLKKFSDFVNEAEVRYSIERLQLAKKTWSPDDEAKEKFAKKNKDAKNINAFMTKDEDREETYRFISYGEGISYNIIVRENGKIIISNSYPDDEKRNFDQDCKIIIGKTI
jgi:hypothetical protein